MASAGGGDGGTNSLEEFVTSEIRRQTELGGSGNNADDNEPASGAGGQAEVPPPPPPGICVVSLVRTFTEPSNQRAVLTARHIPYRALLAGGFSAVYRAGVEFRAAREFLLPFTRHRKIQPLRFLAGFLGQCSLSLRTLRVLTRP